MSNKIEEFNLVTYSLNFLGKQITYHSYINKNFWIIAKWMNMNIEWMFKHSMQTEENPASNCVLAALGVLKTIQLIVLWKLISFQKVEFKS